MPRSSATHSLESALHELQSQRDSIDEAIDALRGLIAKTNGGSPVRRGRKPGPKPGSTRKASKRASGWTAAKKRAAAIRMRAYWKKMRAEGKRGTAG